MNVMIKNIKHILLVAGIILFAASCDKNYLVEPPVGSLSPDGFYTTASHVESGVLGVYAKLATYDIENLQYLHFSEDRSDNIWADPDPNGIRLCSETAFLRIGSATTELGTLWAGWYSLIYNANTVLANIDAVEFDSDAIKNQFKGELLFLRALGHFELARTFGNIPVVDKVLSSTQAKELTQTDAATVMKEHVIPDLTEAENLLPYRSSMVGANGSSVAAEGRADKLAVQALLARVYMTLKGWPFNDSSAKANAQSYLTKVLQNGSSYFAPTIAEWKKQWMTDAAVSNKYQIFAIQHHDTGHGNQLTFEEGVGINNLNYVTDSYHSGSGMTSIYPEATLHYEYESNNDPRGLGFTFMDFYEAYGDTPEYTYRTTAFNYNGQTIRTIENAINIKYCPTAPKRAETGIAFDETSMGTGTSSRNKWPVNFPILRYEDMMLLQAELYAEDGNTAQAMALVNQIRSRAGVPARTAGSKEEALKYVKLERKLELYLEGVRWFDEVRYGEWKTCTLAMWDNYKTDGKYRTNVAPETIKDGRHFLPIPSSETSAVPGLYVQNDGWASDDE